MSSSQTRSVDPRIHEINTKIEQISVEIEKLLDKFGDANSVLINHIGNRVDELDAQVNVYRQQLNELSALGSSKTCSPDELKDYMQHWDALLFDDKRNVVDWLIASIKVFENSFEIVWKI